MKTSRARVVCLSLIAAGLVVSVHLLLRHLDLATGGIGHGTDFCSALFGTGCDATLRSAASWALGIPLAGWGVIYFGTLGTLLLLGWTLGTSFQVEAAVAAFMISVVGALASVALFAIMVMGTVPFCPLCAIVQSVNLALVVPLQRLTGRSLNGTMGALAAAGRYLARGETRDAAQARWKLVGFFATGLVGLVAYQWVWVEVQVRGAQPVAFDPQRTLQAYEEGEQRSVPVGPDDAAVGPEKAAVQLILFSDYECPACSGFSHEMSVLTERFPELRIVVKHYPLDTRCNGSMAENLHPHACEAAWAVEAARRQERFWDFHDALFHADLAAPDALTSIAKGLDLDLERFEADRQGAAARKKVQADIDLGNRLGIDGTPWILLNGRHVADPSLPALEFLIDHLLEHRDP